jgi:Holliday junction resolvase RusA-like endonuclease
MPNIYFTVPGKPVAKARPRFTKSGHTYTPDKTVNFESLVKLCFQQAKPSRFTLLDEPVRVRISAHYLMPKSAPKKSRIDGERAKTTRPDIDNLIKCVLDGLNGIAWRDDAVVYSVISHKIEVITEEFTDVEIMWGEAIQ